jgi:hypothetical protein
MPNNPVLKKLERKSSLEEVGTLPERTSLAIPAGNPCGDNGRSAAKCRFTFGTVFNINRSIVKGRKKGRLFPYLNVRRTL